MAKLPSTFRKRNQTARQFREQYARLPKAIQQATREACPLFDQQPNHPSLRHHELQDRKTARHQPRSDCVSLTMQYRAIYVRVGDVNVWYWIGTHADYKRFTGGKQ